MDARDLLAAVLTQPSADRERFLDTHCDDAALRSEVEALMESGADSSSVDGDFDESTAAGQPPLEPGTHVGPYVIVDSIGAGGMGAVFLGTDTRLHRKVALKCLTSRGTLPEQHAKMLHEARAAARISHPNVAVVHDVVEHGGRAFLVMEYVEGESLAARLRREPLSTNAAIAIGRQLAAALVAAHARGVVHRDLKPANIQLTPDGTVKVVDFGVARAVAALSTATTTSEAAPRDPHRAQPGTPAYMAPELFLGEIADERSDIYSLGVVLYEMLTGRRPYAAPSVSALLAMLADGAPSAHAVNPAVPAAISDVVARAMARDSRVRFQSATELASALAALDTTGTGAAGASPRIGTRRVVVAIAAAAAIVGAIGVPLINRNRSGVARHPPVIGVMPLVGDAGVASASIGAGIPDVLTASLATVPGIVVVPRDSSAKPAPDAAGLASRAKELGLEYAVTGAMRQAGERRSIVLNVIDASRGTIVASRAFESADGTAFALIDEAADWLIGQAEKLSGAAASRRRAAPTSSTQAFEDYSQARQFLDRRDVPGNIRLAIAALERAVARDAAFALAHAALGQAYWMEYQNTRARADLDKAKDATLEALRLEPTLPNVRYALALIYNGTGRPQDAISELEKAIAVQPSSDDLHRLLGRILSETGQVDKGISESLAAIRLRPGFWGNYHSLGTIYLASGRYPDAIATLTRLTELQPDGAPGYTLLGTAYHASGDLEKALENYRRANAIKPTQAAWSNIGTIEYHRRRFVDAAAAYRVAIRLQPREPVPYRNLGDALTRTGDRRGAAAAYRDAIAAVDARLDIEKSNPTLVALKALCLAKIGRLAEARRTIAAAMAASPSAAVLYDLAIIETIDGRRAEALDALSRAIAKGSSAAYARDDDEFVSLREVPEFQRIVSGR